MDGIDFQQIKESFNLRLNRDQIHKTGEAAGASGAFFFFSHDRRFIVKTMPKDELDLLVKLLPEFHRYLSKNPDSLLSRIYGVYTVKMESYGAVHMIVMGNVNRWDNERDVTRVYDLKGSSFSRKVKGLRIKASTTLKDLNFLENQRQISEINLSSLDMANINRVIKRDSDFLSSMNIMDYSILLGIESRIKVSSEEGQSSIVTKKSSMKRLSTTATEL